MLNLMDAVAHDVLAVAYEPFEVAFEIFEGGDPVGLQPLDGVERDDADQRAHAELVELAVRVAQHIIEKLFALVPQAVIAPAAPLHRRADVDVMLEEFRRQPFVHRVLFGQLDGNAHEVQTEHAHPAGGVRLL